MKHPNDDPGDYDDHDVHGDSDDHDDNDDNDDKNYIDDNNDKDDNDGDGKSHMVMKRFQVMKERRYLLVIKGFYFIKSKKVKRIEIRPHKNKLQKLEDA